MLQAAHSATILGQLMPCQPESVALQWLYPQIAGRTRAAFLRAPVAGDFCRNSNDLDLVLFGDAQHFFPERLHAPNGTALDLTWYPAAWLSQPRQLAVAGLAAHRLMAAQLLWDLQGNAAVQRAAFDACRLEPALQTQRIEVLLDLGYLTVREIGVTWDFPALALFWLQMAYASGVAALADAFDLACPNVFTRPFGHIQALERASGLSIKAPMVRTLRLHGNPASLIAPLRRLHRNVLDRYADPDWPSVMRQVTRAEYAYSLPAAELEWRIAAALEMADRGHAEAAIYYLRFWAYSLARLPMVWHRAAEGQDTAFLRPERPVLPDLLAHSPDIVPELTEVLGGPLSLADIHMALAELQQFQQICIELLLSRGLAPQPAKPWQPHKPAQSATLQP